MYDMPVITVRVSEAERKELMKRGNISEAVRDAIEMYLRTRESERLLRELRELQAESDLHTTREEIVRLLREDRKR